MLVRFGFVGVQYRFAEPVFRFAREHAHLPGLRVGAARRPARHLEYALDMFARHRPGQKGAHRTPARYGLVDVIQHETPLIRAARTLDRFMF